MALGALAMALAACTADNTIGITIENKTRATIHTLEVDYPAGPPSNGTQSFGTDRLLADESYHYAFKSTGDGLMKLRFANSSGQTHEEPGPEIHVGDHGRIKITLNANGRSEWASELKPKQ